MKNLCGRSVISRVIERLQHSIRAERLIIATSDLSADDVLIEEFKKCGADYYRGSDSDVLERFYRAAEAYKLEHIARVCADNTLIDWQIIDRQIEIYGEGDFDAVACGKTVPIGLGCEIFSFASLKAARDNATERYQHEHVTPWLYENLGNIYRYELEEDFGRFRFTLDTEQDWRLIQNIYGELYHGENDFLLEDVVRVMDEHADWFDINKDVRQKTVKE